VGDFVFTERTSTVKIGETRDHAARHRRCNVESVGAKRAHNVEKKNFVTRPWAWMPLLWESDAAHQVDEARIGMEDSAA
jgi:hypothetical protein